jgi:ABC-type branched-subunit amino acid transport system permease subunit
MQKSAAIWLASLGVGVLFGTAISSIVCFTFPEFFARLATPSGHLPGLEEEMQSLLVLSGVLTIVCTFLFRWLLRNWFLQDRIRK